MSITFKDRVAIVTGAGGGLGRSHALALAARGVKVVVNDLGGSVDGTGGGATMAENVVAEIEAAGGQAIANGANVTKKDEVDAMVAEAIARFGKVDILINNAGILRDKSFSKMTLADWDLVVAVHLRERLIAQDTRIIDEDIDLTETFNCLRHHGIDFIFFGDIRAVCKGFAACRYNLSDNIICHCRRAACAINRAAKIIDNDFNAARC